MKSKPACHWRNFCLCCLAAAFALPVGAADTNEFSAAELKRLSLEELMNQDVSIVSRREEKLSQSASAVQVITQEEIHRSGATSLPEALRLAPNLQVAQVDSRQWAISARGFNNTLANKLLVMIDGRTIYTPLFAGVFWDAQDTMLEDIDRIEVVSGPGATLWGANAVNGVINIVTKSAKDTQGTLLTAGGGSMLNYFGGVRYGDRISSNLFFRVYGKYFDRDNTLLPGGSDATNDWRMGQGGFRMDWLPGEEDTFTLQGDAYGGTVEQAAPGDTTLDGQNVLGRWRRVLSEDSELTAQAYFDRTWRRIPGQFAEDLKTYDIDVQHRFALGQRQSITWGGDYRLMQDDVDNSAALAFLPRKRNMQLFRGFLQDEIDVVAEKLKLTLGTVVEHNDFSGLETSPSGRIAWMPDARNTLWAAVSHAVRSPSRIDTDLRVPATPPFLLTGGPNFDSEKVWAYELGYRVRPHERVALSVAGFFNDYDDIRSLEPITTNSFAIQNKNRAETWGMELSGNYQVTDWWRLRGGYTFLRKHVIRKEGGLDLNRGRAEGNDPQNQVLLQSMITCPRGFDFDLTARYIDTLPSPNVPSYFTFDARVAWRPLTNLELAVVGQNLWDSQHPEFGAAATRQEIPRSVYGKVTWRF